MHIFLLYPAVHVEDIIFHMFQYIQKLRTEGPQAWVFDECKVIMLSIQRQLLRQRGRTNLTYLVLVNGEMNSIKICDALMDLSLSFLVNAEMSNLTFEIFIVKITFEPK